MARESHRFDLLRTLPSKLGVEATLDDAKELATTALPGGEASLGPTVGALGGGFGACGRVVGHRVVERHHHVWCQLLLDGNRALGTEQPLHPSLVSKVNAVLVDASAAIAL